MICMKLRRLALPAALVVATSAVLVLNRSTAVPNAEKRNAQELQQEADGDQVDQQGVFYIKCGLDHSASDDPIIHYDMPGMAHPSGQAAFPGGTHDFFCGRGVGARTIPEDMLGRATTAKQLNNVAVPGDTSAWWFPAAAVNGVRVEPKFLKLRYSTGGKGAGTDVPPFGLKIVAGTADPANPSEYVDWGCLPGSPYEQNPEHRPCAPNTDTRVQVKFPDCWDGVNLDSPNHRDHMAYSKPVLGQGPNAQCPPTHPKKILQIIAWVHYGKNFPAGEVTLASGGSWTAHGDFMNGWDMDTLRRLKRNCIDLRLKRCFDQP